jgi:hypothetical protein
VPRNESDCRRHRESPVRAGRVFGPLAGGWRWHPPSQVVKLHSICSGQIEKQKFAGVVGLNFQLRLVIYRGAVTSRERKMIECNRAAR